MRAIRALILVLAILVPSAARASPGSLDTTFGSGGKVLTALSPLYWSFAYAVAIQQDRKIVAAGGSYIEFDFAAVVRYTEDGALDPSFGVGGHTYVSGIVGGSAKALAIQPDGKIVVATDHCQVARLNPNGTTDATFGSNGLVSLNLCQSAAGVAVDPFGRIVIVADHLAPPNDKIVVIRLTAVGNLDTTFNSTGSATVASVFSAGGSLTSTGVALTPTGKIMALGYQFVSNLGLNSATILLGRVNDDGTMNIAFGPDASGLVATNVSPQSTSPSTQGPSDYGYALAVAPGGEIVVAGSASDGTIPSQFLVLRYTPSGNLDTTFNGTGFVTRAIGVLNSQANAVAIQPNGKIVAAGRSVNGISLQLEAVRYLANGSPDNEFGTSGLATVTFPGSSYASGVAVEDTGELILAGAGSNIFGPSLLGSGFALVALEGDAATAPPQTSITSIPEIVSNPGGAFTFGATDASGTGISGFECSLDGAAFAACASPRAFSGLSDGVHTFRVRARDNAGAYDPTPASFTWRVSALRVMPRLVNISTRGQVGTGFDVMIGGFVIGGSTAKTVAVRAIGPSLASFGIPGPLANPQIQLVRSSDQTIVATNDEWTTAANAAQLVANWLAPTDGRESTILVSLQPGAYTAIVSGASNGTGTALVEVYELDRPESPLVNISTRGKVLTGFDVMIGGIALGGDGPQTVVVRAIGPSLANYGVAGPLANPQLQLVRQSDQTIIASNDDWGSASNAAALQASGFAPSNPLESALYITLDPGLYTAIVSGVNNGTGVGLVEVYKVGP